MSPEIHPVVTVYFPEGLQFQNLRNAADRILCEFDRLTDKLEEKEFNRMLSPKEYNTKIDNIVGEIADLYKQIEELVKLKIQI